MDAKTKELAKKLLAESVSLRKASEDKLRDGPLSIETLALCARLSAEADHRLSDVTCLLAGVRL